MNNLFKENARIFSILLVLLFVLIFVVYYVFVSPLSKQLKAAKQSVSDLETEITLLEAKREQSKDSLDADILRLEKKVPLAPELEKLLLTFQEIELVSGSRIGNIEFRYDGELPENTSESTEEDETANDEASEEKNESAANEVNTETNESEENIEGNQGDELQPTKTRDENKPEFLKTISAKMEVLSPDYDSFQAFLKELEKRERIMRVDKLTFKKPAERELLEGSKKTITFTIETTTFYYEQ